jgi:hypothetical protein
MRSHRGYDGLARRACGRNMDYKDNKNNNNNQTLLWKS